LWFSSGWGTLTDNGLMKNLEFIANQLGIHSFGEK
jgi:hypothetical protein